MARAQSRLLLDGGFAIAKGHFDNGYQSSVTTSYDRVTIQNTPIYAIVALVEAGESVLSIARTLGIAPSDAREQVNYSPMPRE